MINATSTGGASNVVYLPTKSRPVQPVRRDVPFCAVACGGDVAAGVPAPWFFEDGRLQLQAIVAHTPFTMLEVCRAVETGLISGLAGFSKGRLNIAGFLHEATLAGGETALLGLLESNGDWVGLSDLAGYLEDVAYDLGVDCAALWSPSPLIRVDGWTACQIPGGESGHGLKRIL